jgi:predicted phosphodiesterase
MGALTEPLIVVSDVHFEHGGAAKSALRLAKLLDARQGHELVLAGDIFNLSLDRPSVEPAVSIRAMIAQHSELVAAMARHLTRGDAITFVAGNHDAGVAQRGVRERLLGLLGVQGGARLTLEPWFLRRDGVHVEHGHVYDPDNAPAHPLAPWSPETEPLGVSLTRRFLSPHRAFTFAHAHHTTPLAGLLRACEVFGVRTPLMVLHYFMASGRLTAESAVPERLSAEKARGAAALSQFADRSGLDAVRLERLLQALPRPTHANFRDTFFRLYFDRVLATLGVAGGTLRLLSGGPLGGACALACALYLHSSWKSGVDRYSNLPVKRLHEGAALVRIITGASTVVFGHTHTEDEADGYVNSASFTYTKRSGSPYLVIDTDQRVLRLEIA